MKRGAYLVFLYLLLGAVAHAAVIQGQIRDERGGRMVGVKILIIDEYGETRAAYTEDDGRYRIADLPEGWYTIRLEKLENFIVVEPSCGWYYDYVDGSGNYDFTLRSSGVSVDFGRPGGGTGGGGTNLKAAIGKTAFATETVFDLSVYINGLGLYGFTYPTRVEIEGWWYSGGFGPLSVDVLGGYPAGAYAGTPMNISYAAGLANNVYLSMGLGQSPYLAYDGELATFTFRASPMASTILARNNYDACFCISYVNIWSSDLLLYSSEANWCGKVVVSK